MSLPTRRIIYVPGVRAKPPPEVHRALIRRCVLEGVRRADPAVAAELEAAKGVLRPLLWGHLFYADYRDPALDAAAIEALLSVDAPGADSIREVRGFRWRLDYLAHRLVDRFPELVDRLAGGGTRLNLLDSGRYFRNENGLADRIRAMLAAELEGCWARGERVLLMAHSLGSVIAWDTLWTLTTAGRSGPVDTFLTLGSPLGTRYIRRRLLGGRESGTRRYPRGIRRWWNLAAEGGLTALGHRFAEDYAEMRTLGLVGEIRDRVDLINPFRGVDGLNVHRCYGYFVNPATGAAIARWWRQPAD